ncbi:MAG TPA: matrixin family metalloprotease [Myxococcota bacterium]|nr:matrixin family metalloprotease [Myxococcota bacterium]
MSRAARRRALAAAVLLAVGPGCAGIASESTTQAAAFRPSRRDYAAFRAAFPDLPEPNYLPFVAHRVPARDARGDALVFCRWEASQMPVRVSIEAPEIPDALQDEFQPVAPGVFVAAVERALDAWERALPGAVRFERVTQPERATLRVRLLGEVAPAPEDDVAVLGSTSLAGACRAGAAEDGTDRIAVRFEANEVRLYVADDFGLLTRDQVERIALHELGHALGMRGHSPIPADLMYESARESSPATGLSAEDVNTFRALYRLPNGTVYAWLDPGATEIAGPPPTGPGPVLLADAPYVDARSGLRFTPPRGWLVGETPYAVYAIDGTPWDFDASLQLAVQRAASAEGYLARRQPTHLGKGRLRSRSATTTAGRPGVRLEIEGRVQGLRERVDVIELGDGRVIVAIADAPSELYGAYTPWFDAVLGTVGAPPGPDRP